MRVGRMSKSNCSSLYRRHRFPPDVIAHAVWLYFHFPFSLRMVEDLLAARGIIVSHQIGRVTVSRISADFIFRHVETLGSH